MNSIRRDLLLLALPGIWAMSFPEESKPAESRKITVVLHLDSRLVEECRIAQESRNNISLEEWITETIANAVSDRSVLPRS